MIPRNKPDRRNLNTRKPGPSGARAHRRTCTRCGVSFICGRFGGLTECCQEPHEAVIPDEPCLCPACREEITP